MAAMLIGQSQAETMLARAVAADRVGHAYLFLGPTGAGKATAARLFTQAMNCARQPAAAVRDQGSGARDRGSGLSPQSSALIPTPTHPHTHTLSPPAWQLAPCGECESCRRIAAETHPEVMEVRPESKTGQDIKIAQSREIRRNAALRPKLGRRRVYIIPNAEAFNEHSANALLKTLEEPSEFVTLILCAPNPSQVLPTIRSRCQLVRFGLAAPEEIAAALQARGLEADAAEALARASGGRPGLALSWVRNPAILEQRRRVLDLLAQALAYQRRAAREPHLGAASLRLAEQFRGLAGKEKEREKEDEDGPARPAKVLLSEALDLGLGYFRDLLLLSEGADSALVQNQDRLSQLRDLVSPGETRRVLEGIQSLREAQQLLERNVAPQLVLERMFWAVIAGRHPLPGALFQEIEL